jgi:hypothetical protein
MARTKHNSTSLKKKKNAAVIDNGIIRLDFVDSVRHDVMCAEPERWEEGKTFFHFTVGGEGASFNDMLYLKYAREFLGRKLYGNEYAFGKIVVKKYTNQEQLDKQPRLPWYTESANSVVYLSFGESMRLLHKPNGTGREQIGEMITADATFYTVKSSTHRRCLVPLTKKQRKEHPMEKAYSGVHYSIEFHTVHE